MSNVRSNYHKGRFRSHEWDEPLGRYLKTLGNRKWRRTAPRLLELGEERVPRIKKSRKRSIRRSIHIKITQASWNGRSSSSYRKYRTWKDVENAVKRPSVIRYCILDASGHAIKSTLKK